MELTELDLSSSLPSCNWRGTGDHSRFTTCLVLFCLVCPGDRIFSLRVPGVARRKERGGICPHFSKVATHERCAHRSARPCHVQAQELGGYICILIGGVGRRRSERESGEMLCEFGVAPCPLSRYTLVHRSNKPAQRKKYQYSCYHRSSITHHAFLNFPTKPFGRTPDVTWSRLCS